ncbi:MAG: glycosyltransferase family 2 protein [Candidatus Bathyarchaeia archaeon]
MVILNHNSSEKLGEETYKFLESIMMTRYDNLDIVIVDNGSTDGSIEEIEKRFGHLTNVKIIKSSTNLGYAGGNNLGFKAHGLGSKYVVFINNDIEVEEDWLGKIIEIMEKNPSIAAAQPKILQLRNKEIIDSLGGKIDKLGRAYDLFHGLRDKENITRPFETFYARGAAIVIRSEIFRRLQGFDEDYFIYYEETDLCWRIRLLGYRIVTVPNSKVYHLGGGTTGGPTPYITYLRRRNQLMMLLKNYSFKNILKYVPPLCILYIVYSLKRLILRRDVMIFKIYMSAILWNLRNFKKIITKRRIIQNLRRVSDDAVLKHMMTIREYDVISAIMARKY